MTVTDPTRIHCAHGYVLMQDSCPGCNAEQETPHPANLTEVKPDWATTTYTRCRTCGQTPSHRIHKTH